MILRPRDIHEATQQVRVALRTNDTRTALDFCEHAIEQWGDLTRLANTSASFSGLSGPSQRYCKRCISNRQHKGRGECCVHDHEVRSALCNILEGIDNDPETAVRVANIAASCNRIWVWEDYPSSEAWSKEYEAHGCEETRVAVIAPAPKHTLRMYVNALMKAMPNNWFSWLEQNTRWNRSRYRKPFNRPLGEMTGLSPTRMPTVTVFITGLVEASRKCPLLPKVPPGDFR
jgi:hypothetical protein